MQTVTTTHAALLSKAQYPPAFDGSKTVRPGPKKLIVPKPASLQSETPVPINDLEFAPPPVSCKTLEDVLAGACDEDVNDSMHVSAFEKLMRSTNHDLIALAPPSFAQRPNICKQFLKVEVEREHPLCRCDFARTRQADLHLSATQAVSYWMNKVYSFFFGHGLQARYGHG